MILSICIYMGELTRSPFYISTCKQRKKSPQKQGPTGLPCFITTAKSRPYRFSRVSLKLSTPYEKLGFSIPTATTYCYGSFGTKFLARSINRLNLTFYSTTFLVLDRKVDGDWAVVRDRVHLAHDNDVTPTLRSRHLSRSCQDFPNLS